MLPAFGLLVFISIEERDSERHDASVNAIRYADGTGREVERSVGSIQDLLLSLSLRDAVRRLDSDGCNQLLASLQDDYPAYKDGYFLVADLRGDTVCSDSPLEPGDPIASLSERDFFKRAVAGGKFTVGSYEAGQGDGIGSVTYAQPVFAGREMVAVLLAGIPAEVLSSRVSDASLPDGAVYLLLDRNGTVIATNVDAKTGVGQSVAGSELATVIGGRAGTAEVAGLDGEERLYGFTPVGTLDATGLTLVVGIPTSVAYGAIDRALTRNLALMGIVAVAAMFAVWLGSVFLSRQTRRLISDVQRYASGETVWHAPERGGVREITELHNAFHSMASVIDLRDRQREEAADELEESNVQLERRVAGRTQELNERNVRLEYEIEQRKAAEAELERFAVQVSRTNTDLEEFTYAVSHDLKAPLRGISGFASMVLEDNSESLNDSARESLTVVKQSAEQMRGLIDDLLSLSRIARAENGHSDISMLEEVREVEAEMAYLLKEKGIVLKVAEDLPVIHSGPVRVKQILRNLISNAVKYDDNAKPVIEVGWQQDNAASYTFFVRDNGKGIDARFHDRIFGIFQRLDPRLETEGTGIGLTICKKAVESLDGRIWVESEPGEGSTFYFSLPITSVEADHQPAPDPTRGRQSA